MTRAALVVTTARSPAGAAARLAGAARRVASHVDSLVVGEGADSPESTAPELARLARDYAFVLTPIDEFGRDVLSRAAAILDAAFLRGVIAIPTPTTVVRPLYFSNINATMTIPATALILMTVQTRAFEPADPAVIGRTMRLDVPPPAAPKVRRLRPGARRGPDFASARVVVGAGRGVATPARMESVQRIADRLGAAIGATRPVIDEGFANADQLVGQSGKAVAPALYLALGVSGAMQHLTGVRDAGVVAAINADADAPIFDACDVGLVADLDTALPELEAALAELP